MSIVLFQEKQLKIPRIFKTTPALWASHTIVVNICKNKGCQLESVDESSQALVGDLVWVTFYQGGRFHLWSCNFRACFFFLFWAILVPVCYCDWGEKR